MPRQAGVKVVNKFQRGLITEATGLNFPEDAVTDSLNVVFENESIARRRYGIDFESDFNYQVWTSTDRVIKEYLWENADGNSLYNFVVVQVGDTIRFWRCSASDSLSGEYIASSILLNNFKVAGAPSVLTEECSFASGIGYLFVAHPYCEPFYVAYDSATNTFSATEISLLIRDFDGVEDGYDIEEKRTTITNLHRYNLKNQGWYKNVRRDDEAPLVEPIAHFKDQTGFFPTNADIWWVYKESQGFFRPRDTSDSIALGNTPAPKGHYILDPFYEDRSTVSGVSGLNIVSSGYYRPSVISFFAGRVWYSGMSDRRLGSTIFFSQITPDEKKVGYCYQEQDPTSETTSDLLPTDGGTIKILDVGTIYRMVPIQSSMLVFASNGVWAISGNEGIGFTALDYSIRKISSVPAVSASSFVDVEGFAMWWNYDGIYTVATDNVGNFQVQSLSDQSIKSFFDNIPTISKRYAKADYNSLLRRVQWLYRSEGEAGISNRYEYDSILELNMVSQGFYPHTISPGKIVRGIISIQGRGREEETVGVDAALDNVITSSSDAVVTDIEEYREFSNITKYITTDGTNYTYSEEYEGVYYDWTSSGTPVDYTSYFITGYYIDGQAINRFQPNYVFVYINQDEDSSCFMSGIFDFASSALSNKFSNTQQVYNSNREYYGIRVRKLKVRGHGRALQLKFTSEAGKPFAIIGWGMFESANQVP
jgi:hypothetical protein